MKFALSTWLLMQDFDVFVAQGNAALFEKITAGDTAWCGFERLISGHRHKCSISVAPFQTTFVGIVPSQGRSLFTAGMSSIQQVQPRQLSGHA